VLGDLEDQAVTALDILNLQGVEDGRQVLVLELHVDDGTNDGLWEEERQRAAQRMVSDFLPSATDSMPPTEVLTLTAPS
jgi:hypothetical protein